MQTIKNVILLMNGKRSGEAYDILTDNGVIVGVTASSSKQEPLFAACGYIDGHTHGGYGSDYFDCTQTAADNVGKFHLDNGTTAFCATAVATPLRELDAQFAAIRKLKNNYAALLGVHIEGPYISLARKGAQPEQNIKTVYDEADGEFFERNKDVLRTVTLCPNTTNALALVKKLVKEGITAQAGHDDSVYPQIEAAADCGLSAATHIYCASSGVRRREGDITKYMGLNETAMCDKRLYTEVIADGIHIPDELFEFILKNKGYRRIMLVSDSLSAAGMPVGEYTLGRDTRVYNNGKVVLLSDRKTLAGSICPVGNMVKRLVKSGLPIERAVYMASESTARHLGLNERIGIKTGNVADINVLDCNANIVATYIGGEVYKRY